MSDDTQKRHQNRFRQLRYERNTVKKCLDNLLTSELAAKDNVCVAGSAPLHWLILSYPAERVPMECLFRPNDIDIFVYGSDARTQEAFFLAVAQMNVHLKSKGYKQVRKKVRCNTYILRGIPVWIVDVRYEELSANLSFVQCPTTSTKQEVVSSFDMDIVQVIYDIPSRALIASNSVRDSIATRQATPADFEFPLSAPTSRDMYLLTSTLHRMSKYASRGFNFTRAPEVYCQLADVTMSPAASTLPEYQEVIDPVLFDAKFADVIKLLEDVVPPHVLRSGAIGLIGELPLVKLLNDNASTINRRVASPWDVQQANICICGDELAHDIFMFETVVHALKHRMKNNLYRFKTTGRAMEPIDGLGMRAHTFYVRVQDIATELRFICCPHDPTCENVAGRAKLGIERIWYDFNDHICRTCPGVKEQIDSAIVKVGDLNMRDHAPTNGDVKRIVSVVDRMRYYHSQGFVFANYPQINTGFSNEMTRDVFVYYNENHWRRIERRRRCQRRRQRLRQLPSNEQNTGEDATMALDPSSATST